MWKTKGPACRQAGFTLVELLVVMGVIGVLSVMVSVIAIGGNIGKGNDARRKTDLEAIRSALEIYRNEIGSYPADLPTLPSSIINSVPSDPKSPTYTYYYAKLSSSTYQLCAYMQTISNANGTCGVAGSCGPGITCNYLLLNP